MAVSILARKATVADVSVVVGAVSKAAAVVVTATKTEVELRLA